MIRSLPLHQVHAAAEARFGEKGGAEVVLGFSPPSTEYRWLTETVGVVDRSHRPILRIGGPEAKVFLHGVVTNDVKGVAPGSGNYTAVVNSRGKMLGDARLVVRGEDELLLDFEPESHEGLVAHLDQHLISEDCELQDLTGLLALLGAYGPHARAAMEAAIGAFPELPPFGHQTIELEGTEAVIIAASPAGVDGFELLLNADVSPTVWQRLLEGARAGGGGAVGDEALDAVRIHHSIPRYGADMSESTIPLEANLERAISYTKGCYVGQEVIAKATYRGRLRRYLGQLEIPPGTAVGASLVDGERIVGSVAAVLDPDPGGGPPLALAYVRPERLVVGETIAIEGGGEAVVRWAPAPRER